MTPQWIFWLQAFVWLLIGYSIFELVRKLMRTRSKQLTSREKRKQILEGITTIGLAVLLLVILYRNYQEPVNLIMHQDQDSFPKLTYTETGSKQRMDLVSEKGKLVLLNLWATWCGPCRREMPALDQIQRQYGTEKLAVIALSDEDLPTVEQFIKLHDFHFSTGVYEMPHPILDQLQTRPVSILISPEGKVIDMVVGSRGQQFFSNWVEKHLPITKSP